MAQKMQHRWYLIGGILGRFKSKKAWCGTAGIKKAGSLRVGAKGQPFKMYALLPESNRRDALPHVPGSLVHGDGCGDPVGHGRRGDWRGRNRRLGDQRQGRRIIGLLRGRNVRVEDA